MPTPLERIRQARESMHRVRIQLLHPTPEALERGAVDLARAVEVLNGLDSASSEMDQLGVKQAVRAELAGLRKELHTVNELLQAAGHFYAGWAQLISGIDTGTSNYAAAGRARQGEPRRGLVIHG